MNLSFKRQEPPPDYPPQIVLASQSIGRKILLEKLGVRFRVVVTRVDEDKIIEKDPMRTIKRRAAAKVDEVVKNPHVYAIPELGKSLVIAADSMAIMGAKMYGKAKDREDAKTIVRALMGKTHVFGTAVCMAYIDKGKEVKRWEKDEKTKITLRKMASPEIDLYVVRYDFTRYAGGYTLNEAPWDFVTKIDGSYTNVVGLPFEAVLPVLRTLKIIASAPTP